MGRSRRAGLTTHGLRWPLDDSTVALGSTWAMSNEVTEAPARVAVDRGTLLVVRPHALTPEADPVRPLPDRPRPPA